MTCMRYAVNLTEYLDDLMQEPQQAGKTALIDGDRTLTFGELYREVLALALSLQQRLGNRTKKVVAVLMPKSIECVIADLAVLYSGNAFLNLAPKQPTARQQAIIRNCDPALVLTLKANQTIGIPEGIDCAALDALRQIQPDGTESDRFNRSHLISTDPLCVITTSGSTGTPKAVLLSHLGLIDFMAAVCADNLLPTPQVVGSLSPAIFDIYLYELCLLISRGSTLLLLPSELGAFPLRLLEQLRDHHATFIFWVPTVMVNIANQDLLAHVKLPDLKTVWFAGEVLPTAKFNYWRRHLPQARLFNFYGPIEISIDCLYQELPDALPESKSLPLGRPFRNTYVTLLNEDLEEVADGEEGELCVGGVGLALGYLNDADKTAAAFITNPLERGCPQQLYRTGDIAVRNREGIYHFKGRRDSLIKRHGYRIELTEIEHAVIDSLKLCRNCCAVYLPDSAELVLCYEAAQEIPVADFSRSLLTVLPRYMLPGRFKRFDTLPRTATGKIDRAGLKALEEQEHV